MSIAKLNSMVDRPTMYLCLALLIILYMYIDICLGLDGLFFVLANSADADEMLHTAEVPVLQVFNTKRVSPYPVNAEPRSAVGKVFDCRSRGREFDPGPVLYFRGD